MVGALVATLMTAGSIAGILGPLHAGASSLLFWWYDPFPSPHVIVVAIDDNVVARFQQKNQIPRDYLGRVVRGITRSGGRAIGLVSVGPMRGPGDPLYEAIQEAEAARIPVVTAIPEAAQRGTAERSARVGVLAVQDAVTGYGVVRSFQPLAVGADGTPVPSMALALLTGAAGSGPFRPDRNHTYGTTALYWPSRLSLATPVPASLEVTPAEWRPITYIGRPGSFLTIPSDVLAVLATDPRPHARRSIQGRIVLVGPTFAETGERMLTPWGEMTTVEVQANVVHTLLTRGWMTPARWIFVLLTQLLIVGGAAVLFASLHPLEAVLVALIGVAGAFVPFSVSLYSSADYWVDLALPVLAVFVYVRSYDHVHQRRLHVTFSRYVSPEVVKHVLASREHTLRAEQREVTILFCDLRDSTALGEKLPPNELMRLLNDYFALVTEAVFRHGGMINKFIGDGILAVYNAPLDVAAHADAAVKSAIEIQAEMDRMNRRWSDWLAARLSVGIGIHSGTVFAGNVGSSRRMEYTIIGDPVNVASRVESLTKEFGATILLTKETRHRLHERYPFKALGSVPLRGRSEPIELFEVS